MTAPGEVEGQERVDSRRSTRRAERPVAAGLQTIDRFRSTSAFMIGNRNPTPPATSSLDEQGCGKAPRPSACDVVPVVVPRPARGTSYAGSFPGRHRFCHTMAPPMNCCFPVTDCGLPQTERESRFFRGQSLSVPASLQTYQQHTGARNRGCFTCGVFNGRIICGHAVCEHRGGTPVIGQPVNGCAYWQREPWADDE